MRRIAGMHENARNCRSDWNFLLVKLQRKINVMGKKEQFSRLRKFCRMIFNRAETKKDLGVLTRRAVDSRGLRSRNKTPSLSVFRYHRRQLDGPYVKT